MELSPVYTTHRTLPQATAAPMKKARAAPDTEMSESSNDSAAATYWEPQVLVCVCVHVPVCFCFVIRCLALCICLCVCLQNFLTVMPYLHCAHSAMLRDCFQEYKLKSLLFNHAGMVKGECSCIVLLYVRFKGSIRVQL
jgi:hypothetical protein